MNIYLLIVLLVIKDITYVIAFSFLFIYVVYVIIVVIQSKFTNEEDDEETSRVIRNAKEFQDAAQDLKKRTKSKSSSIAEIGDLLNERKASKALEEEDVSLKVPLQPTLNESRDAS